MSTADDHTHDRDCISGAEATDLIENAVKGGMMAGLRGAAEALRPVGDDDRMAVVQALAKDHEFVLDWARRDPDAVERLISIVVADVVAWLDLQADEIGHGQVHATVLGPL